MKARVTAALPKLAAGINVGEEKEAALMRITEALGIGYKSVDDDCGSDTVGYICGLKGYEKSEERSGVSAEILILSGLDRNDMNSLLEKLRAEKVSIPLKAMLTPHNRDWKVSALAEELAKEHEYMTNMGKRDGNG